MFALELITKVIFLVSTYIIFPKYFCVEITYVY